MATWMMSNRQPWTELVINKDIHVKTRNATNLKSGDIVFLHASKALWSGWRDLELMAHQPVDATTLPRGVVYGVAVVDEVGQTEKVMPREDARYFVVRGKDGDGQYKPELKWFCAMPISIVFKPGSIMRLPELACRGVQRSAKKLPPELQEALDPSNTSPVAQAYQSAYETLLATAGA